VEFSEKEKRSGSWKQAGQAYEVITASQDSTASGKSPASGFQGFRADPLPPEKGFFRVHLSKMDRIKFRLCLHKFL